MLFSFISDSFPSIYPCLWLFLISLVRSWFMKMHERIRRKVHLTYSSDKSWKCSILGIRYIENAHLAAFSKDFLLLNNRKKQCVQKGCVPNFQNLKFGKKYPLIDPNSLTKSHWKRIYRTLKWNDTEHMELTFMEWIFLKNLVH